MGRITLDAVRANRVRQVIERSVRTATDRKHQPHNEPGKMPPMTPQSARGSPPEAFARQIAMYLAHVSCGLTYTEAARLYGRDRTTAAHGCAVVEERRDDPAFDRLIEVLETNVWLGLCQSEPALAARLDA